MKITNFNNDLNYDKNKDKVFHSFINFYFTIVVVLTPVLFNYGIGFGSLSLIDLLLIIVNIMIFFSLLNKRKIKVFMNLVPFFIFVLFIFLLNVTSLTILFTTLRFFFYLFNVIMFSKNFFNFSLGLKTYQFVSVFATVYLFLQIFLYEFSGFYLPGVILNFDLLASDLYSYENLFNTQSIKRFFSIFEESSHYSIYILGYITFLLHDVFIKRIKSLKKIFLLFFLSAGIFYSTSILGVGVLFLILLVFTLSSLIINSSAFFNIIPQLFLIIISSLLITLTPFFDYINVSNVFQRQVDGRFSGYKIFLDFDNSFIHIFFGRGMIGTLGNEYNSFLPSYPLLFYYFGFFGLILFLGSFIPYFIKLKPDPSFFLLITFLIIGSGSEFILGRNILLFLPFIINGNTKSIISRKNSIPNII